MVRLLQDTFLAAALLAGTAVATSCAPRSPVQRNRTSTLAATPRPWPTVIPQHKQQARLALEGFSRAVVHGRDSQATRYLAPTFRGRCGRATNARDSLTTILCRMPRPAGYQVFSIDNGDRSGSVLDAVVIYRLHNGRRQPLAFNLRPASSGWAITSIGLLQG